MILRDNVLEIRFDLDERQIHFVGNPFRSLKDFLLDTRNIFFAVATVNRADVENANVRQILIGIVGIQMLKDGIEAVYAARKSGAKPPP